MRAVRPVSVVETITHGSQINAGNTGYGAYFDTGLGRNVILDDLTVTPGVVGASDFVTTGGTISKRHFTGNIIIDLNNITLRACLFDNQVLAYYAGTHYPGALLDYCTIYPTSVTGIGIGFEGWSANRCQIRNVSDCARTEGGAVTQNIIECYMRVAMQSFDDHNDVFQSTGGSGTVNIRRSNLSADPEVIISGPGGPNSVIMWSEYTASSVFHGEVTDCLLNGGGGAYVLRFYDGIFTSNVTFLATGNRFVRTAALPFDRGAANTTPIDQVTWSGNVWDDDDSTIPLV